MGRRNGANHFIHEPNFEDGVGDCLFTKQCISGGAAYAPYLFDVQVVDHVATLRYTLSTWNPIRSC